jgi:choline dehydrogenase-like flavoprotein
MAGPAFLLRNRLANSSRRVGRGLQIHPACRVAAEFDEIVDGHVGLSQGAYVDKWKDRGVMLEGIFLHPGFLIAMIPGIGQELKEVAAAYRHLSAFGAFVDDTSVGRVLPGYFGTKFSAFYQMNRADAASLQFGVARIAEIYLAAGAKRVFTPYQPKPIIDSAGTLAEFEARKVKPADFELAAFHPLGTCAMGADPKKSVVDFSLKTHDINDLYIMDGSVIPHSLGVNPQVTIMSLALRAARQLAEKLK